MADADHTPAVLTYQEALAIASVWLRQVTPATPGDARRLKRAREKVRVAEAMAAAEARLLWLSMEAARG